MSAPPPGVPPPLSERDISYLKLLKTLKSAGSTGAELGVVRRIGAWIDSVPVLNFISGNQAWYDDWEVKEALIHNDATPLRYRRELEKAIAIFELLRELDDPRLSQQDETEIQDDIRHLFKVLPDHDRQVVKKHAYALSASRRKADVPGPAARMEGTGEAPPKGAHAFAEELTGELTGGLPHELPGDGSATEALRVTEEEAAGVPAHVEELDDEPVADLEPPVGLPVMAMPVEARLELARTSQDADAFNALAYDASEDVLLALVGNAAFPERLAAVVARRATSRVASAIHANRRLFMRPAIQHAMTECPNTPSSALLEIVNSTSGLKDLMKLITSPKVRYLEVKAKARSRLSATFRAMGSSEKLAAIRSSGRQILKELWTDFFRDEALVIQCLQEKSVDQGIVLEIARSKVAPRRALEVIAASPTWVANYQILLELVMNPKTPRQVVTKLLPRLKPQDRQMIRNNPAIPDAIRKFA